MDDATYDAFIAYASADAHYARRLHALLSATGLRVFLDSEALVAGDDWQASIRRAQEQARLNLILVSNRSDPAYFQREEMLTAIDSARDGRCRVVPVYLTGMKGKDAIRSPLKQLQGITWDEGASLLGLAGKIVAALDASGPWAWLHDVVPDTIVIVTGCHHIAEVYDRPTAYMLRTSIESAGRSVDRTFLRALVVGDLWFLNPDSRLSDHGAVISIGPSAFNGVTGRITDRAKTIRASPDGRWQIRRDGNRWAIFGSAPSGSKVEDTREAANAFAARELPGFLSELWR